MNGASGPALAVSTSSKPRSSSMLTMGIGHYFLRCLRNSQNSPRSVMRAMLFPSRKASALTLVALQSSRRFGLLDSVAGPLIVPGQIKHPVPEEPHDQDDGREQKVEKNRQDDRGHDHAHELREHHPAAEECQP